VLNKRTKIDLINTFKRIILLTPLWTIIPINYRLLIGLTVCVRILFYYFFILGIQFSQGIVLTETPKPSEYASTWNGSGGGGGESCDSFVPSSFPVGNSTWRSPLHTLNTILALDMCIYIYIYIYAFDDCVFITHTTRNSLTFFRRVLCATSLRVCVCVYVYLITGQKLSSFRRCPNGRLSRVILSRPINKLMSAAECVLQFHVHNGFFSLHITTENPYETFGKINTCDVEHGLCARRPRCSDVYIHYTYSRFTTTSYLTMISCRIPQLSYYYYYYYIICGWKCFRSTTIDYPTLCQIWRLWWFENFSD